MPVYVYKNLNTGETFEVEQRITESALTAHPESGDPVKRLIQPVGIAFKGSGFYVTDSRSSSKAASKPAKDGDSAGAASSDGAKSSEATAKTDAAKPAATGGGTGDASSKSSTSSKSSKSGSS